jgi:antirestriction protein ArdC
VAILRRVINLFRSASLEREFDEEIQFHLGERTRRNLAVPMNACDAAAAARTRFGSIERAKIGMRKAHMVSRFSTVLAIGATVSLLVGGRSTGKRRCACTTWALASPRLYRLPVLRRNTPWRRGARTFKAPCALAASSVRIGQPYTGINILSLWASATVQGFAAPIWMTYRQAVELRAHVRKGEKARPSSMRTASRATRPTPTAASKSRATSTFSRVTPCSTSNRSRDCPRSTRRRRHRLDVSARIARAERFFGATGATLAHGGNRAFYRPSTDSIVLPPFETFRDAKSYYATLVHEMTHWTAHESRLARDFGTKRFGSEGYAIEELVAELGAAFLCADLDLTLEPPADHAAYIANWLDVLKADNRAIFTAASHAQRAADFINGLQPAASAG